MYDNININKDTHTDKIGKQFRIINCFRKTESNNFKIWNIQMRTK